MQKEETGERDIGRERTEGGRGRGEKRREREHTHSQRYWQGIKFGRLAVCHLSTKLNSTIINYYDI